MVGGCPIFGKHNEARFRPKADTPDIAFPLNRVLPWDVVTKKNWKRKSGVDLPDDLNVLLAKLCVGWGFCNRLSGADLIRDFPALSADEFACAVLRAEDMDPERYDKHRDRIAKVFADRYGPSVSPSTFVGPLKFI